MDSIKLGDGAKVALGLLPGVVGIIVFAWLAFAIFPGGQLSQNIERLEALGVVVVALGIGFGVVALLRFALMPLLSSRSATATGADADTNIRSRIGPLVLAIGSVAISLLALALIVAFVVLSFYDEQIKTKIDTLLNGVFTTVLPVVATWVGTVLAFYFGSENFRQAAQSTRDAIGAGAGATKKVTDVMTPYERIARLDADSADAAATDLHMMDVIHTMSAAAPRVIIFDKAKQTPIYVIRSNTPKPMPEGWVTADYAAGDALPKTLKDPNDPKSPIVGPPIKDYLALNNGDNKADAQRFCFAPASITVQDAIALMKQKGVDDLFITSDGQPASRVLGWVTLNDLQRG